MFKMNALGIIVHGTMLHIFIACVSGSLAQHDIISGQKSTRKMLDVTVEQRGGSIATESGTLSQKAVVDATNEDDIKIQQNGLLIESLDPLIAQDSMVTTNGNENSISTDQTGAIYGGQETVQVIQGSSIDADGKAEVSVSQNGLSQTSDEVTIIQVSDLNISGPGTGTVDIAQFAQSKEDGDRVLIRQESDIDILQFLGLYDVRFSQSGISSENEGTSTVIEIADADLTILNGFVAALSDQQGINADNSAAAIAANYYYLNATAAAFP